MVDKTIWGIHMPLELGLGPVSAAYVAIGWENMGDLSKITATREAFKDRVAATHPETKPGAVPGAAGVLYRYAVEMQIGDVVIYPRDPSLLAAPESSSLRLQSQSVTAYPSSAAAAATMSFASDALRWAVDSVLFPLPE